MRQMCGWKCSLQHIGLDGKISASVKQDGQQTYSTLSLFFIPVCVQTLRIHILSCSFFPKWRRTVGPEQQSLRTAWSKPCWRSPPKKIAILYLHVPENLSSQISLLPRIPHPLCPSVQLAIPTHPSATWVISGLYHCPHQKITLPAVTSAIRLPPVEGRNVLILDGGASIVATKRLRV